MASDQENYPYLPVQMSLEMHHQASCGMLQYGQTPKKVIQPTHNCLSIALL